MPEFDWEEIFEKICEELDDDMTVHDERLLTVFANHFFKLIESEFDNRYIRKVD